MSKYAALWAYIREKDADTLQLSFADIERICGIPLDHAFLQYKKELTAYGYSVAKISMKQQTVLFTKSESKGATV